jgi:hypothetical protein
MRAVEKEYGIAKSTVQRAFKRLQGVIASETGRDATRRARSRALAYHLGYLSASQKAEIKARLDWDTGLLMAVRSLELGGRRALALLPPGGIAVDAASRSGGFADRLAAVADGMRQHACSLVGRSSGHEAETAGGIAGGGAGAGLATKAIVAACVAGGGAVGVGGACVATGVVDLPQQHGDSKPVAEKTMPEPTATVPTTPAVAAEPDPAPVEEPAPSEPTTTIAEKPVQQVNKELYGGGGSTGSSASASTSRDFAAPVGSSNTSGGGGGSGGSGGSRENFGP